MAFTVIHKFDNLFNFDWELTTSPAGAKQWIPKAGAASDAPCVLCEDAIAEAANAMAGVEKKRRTPRARDAVQGLIKSGHLQRGLDDEQEEWLWLT